MKLLIYREDLVNEGRGIGAKGVTLNMIRMIENTNHYELIIFLDTITNQFKILKTPNSEFVGCVINGLNNAANFI